MSLYHIILHGNIASVPLCTSLYHGAILFLRIALIALLCNPFFSHCPCTQAYKFGWMFAACSVTTIAFYTALTFAITQWRYVHRVEHCTYMHTTPVQYHAYSIHFNNGNEVCF